MIPKTSKNRMAGLTSRFTHPMLCKHCGKAIKKGKKAGKGGNYVEFCQTCLNGGK
jgi:ribosome-binding protein aMBF1 (putative translation factor)